MTKRIYFVFLFVSLVFEQSKLRAEDNPKCTLSLEQLTDDNLGLWKAVRLQGRFMPSSEYQMIVGESCEMSSAELWFLGVLRFPKGTLLSEPKQFRFELSSKNQIYMPWTIFIPGRLEIRVLPVVIPIRKSSAFRKRIGNLIEDESIVAIPDGEPLMIRVSVMER